MMQFSAKTMLAVSRAVFRSGARTIKISRVSIPHRTISSTPFARIQNTFPVSNEDTGKSKGKLFSSEPVEDAEAISHIAFGFMASKALFAALDLELFAKLSKDPISLEELAANVPSVQFKQLETLTTVLVSIGLLARNGAGELSNPPAVEAFLSKRKPGYDFGDYLRLQIDKQMYPFMGDVNNIVTGKPAKATFKDYDEWMSDKEAATLYTESQHAGSIGPAKSLSRMESDTLGQLSNMIDVGGGSGGFAITLAKGFPNLNIKVLDFPNVCEVGRGFVASADIGQRVDFVPGNALESDFPQDQCGVLMSYLSSSVPGDTLEPLYKKAFDATRSGGVIYIHDFMVENDRNGPPLAALWALQHMVFTPGAKSLTPDFITKTLEAAGWTDVRVKDLIPGMTKVAIAKKP
eukprot:m.123420 g.123420  ORF g.123420 m.123420 type:complete len:406 (-) comp28987_c0_seq1:171-1388(-)